MWKFRAVRGHCCGVLRQATICKGSIPDNSTSPSCAAEKAIENYLVLPAPGFSLLCPSCGSHVRSEPRDTPCHSAFQPSPSSEKEIAVWENGNCGSDCKALLKWTKWDLQGVKEVAKIEIWTPEIAQRECLTDL